MSGISPDLTQKLDRAAFTIGACDRDNCGGLIWEQDFSGSCIIQSRIFRRDERQTHRIRVGRANDRHGTISNGLRNEIAAIQSRSRQGRKDKARLHLAGVRRQARNPC